MSGGLNSLASQFDGLRNDYEAMKESRFVRRRTGLAPNGGPADYHIRNESKYYELIEKARDMDRNDSLIGQMVDRAVSNIIQNGFVLTWNTGDKDLDLELWYRWKEFTTDPDQCDIAGQMTFVDFERASMRAQIVDGDCLLVGTKDGPLQFWESHSIRTPKGKKNCVLGVEMDSYRRHVNYHVEGDFIDPETSKKKNSMALPVFDGEGIRQAFLIYKQKRSSLSRGITALAPIFPMAGILEDVNFAKLVQQQIVSCFAIFRQQAAAMTGAPPTADGGYGESSVETTQDGTRYIEGIAPGMEIIGKPGEQLQGFSPNVPNSEYFQQVRLVVSVIGAVLNIPYCIATLDFQGENFVGYKGAIDEARRGFRAEQSNHIKRFHNPVTKWKLSQWANEDSKIARGLKRAKVRGNPFLWKEPAFPYADPVNDAAGDLLRVRNGLTSRRRLAAERNDGDWEEIADEMVEDNAYIVMGAKQKADEINAQFPFEQISWRDLVNLPTPDGIQVAIPTVTPGGNRPANNGDTNAN